MTRRIYLDYAAATPMSPEVLEAMKPYYADRFYNPSATYLSAKSVKRDLETARERIAKLLGARPPEIVFTSGATEANNLAIQGVMNQFQDHEALVSSIEHASVLEPARLFSNREIPVDDLGIILLNKLSNLITDRTVLISIMTINNELGTIQPLREVTKIIQTIRQRRLASANKTPLYLHTDAAQAGNYLDLHVSRLGIDLLTINGGKLYGPKQSGALYIRSGLSLKPLITGGGQEFGLRSGTENLAGSIGLAAAFEASQVGRRTEQVKIKNLRIEFETAVIQQVASAQINGSSKHRAPHISSITFAGIDNERLVMELDELGIECAAGSACGASSDEPSHVLKALGLSREAIQSTLRFSFGKQTTAADISVASTTIAKIIASNR